MRVQDIELTQFRNLEQSKICFGEGLNIVYGDNGQGKTNLLEAVWLLTGAKSFRTSRNLELIAHGQDYCCVRGTVLRTGEDERDILITVGKKNTQKPGRQARMDGTNYKQAGQIAGNVTAVVFEPAHLSLIKGSPTNRRVFLDIVMSQVKPRYVFALRRYMAIMEQKNALLRNFKPGNESEFLLSTYNEQLAICGTEVTQMRRFISEQIFPKAQEYYEQISSGKEKARFEYKSVLAAGQGKEEMFHLLEESRAREKSMGCCVVGPHRDDFDVSLNQKSARVYASQGQQRSIALSLKLAEAEILEELTGQRPILLLDDVLSELDIMRKEYLLNHLKGGQIFVSCCEPVQFYKTNGTMIEVSHGSVAVKE